MWRHCLLADARKRRDEAGALLAAGISLAKSKQESKHQKRAEAARALTFKAALKK